MPAIGLRHGAQDGHGVGSHLDSGKFRLKGFYDVRIVDVFAERIAVQIEELCIAAMLIDVILCAAEVRGGSASPSCWFKSNSGYGYTWSLHAQFRRSVCLVEFHLNRV